MIIEIDDATTPMLSAIAQVSAYAAYEQMGKIGAKAKKNTGNRMQSLRNRHHWFQRERNGKRVPYQNLNSAKRLGDRTELDGRLSATPSMANFITSNLMDDSGVLVVGGKNKARSVNYYRDGVKIPNGGKIPAVTSHTQSILTKLDQGKRTAYHGWGKGGSDRESMRNFRNAKYRATNFMEQGFRDTLPYMQDKLTSEYERVVGRAVNRVVVKVSTRRMG